MRVYATRSKQLTLTLKVNGAKKNVVFNRGIREEGVMAIMLIDKDEIAALEATHAFNKEFWFYEERPDVQPKVLPKSNRKVYYKPGTEPEAKEEVKATDYPEVTNGQKAKLLLLSLVKGSVHADFNNSEKARAKAKELNITFSNWPVQ
jgi:hypothetical protein